MQVADEKLIINQSGRSGLGLSNFMQTKHAHEHFDLKLVISPHARLEYLHVFFFIISEKLEVLGELAKYLHRLLVAIRAME